MLLRDGDLANALAGGWLGISGYEPELLQPSSVDVRLDRFFKRFAPGQVIDPMREPEMIDVEVTPDRPMMMRPGEVVLGSTMETIDLSADLAARLEGKSSIARLGIGIHTAGFIDPGFSGHVTLELSNLHRDLHVVLWPGMKIGQLCVFTMSGKADRPYGSDGVGHYQHQRGPTASRAHIGWKTWRTASPS
jgi:dCTP deaminase